MRGAHIDKRTTWRAMLWPRVVAPVLKDDRACPRCDATDYTDVSIHDGQSVRRQCTGCGRHLGFPNWHGHEEPT